MAAWSWRNSGEMRGESFCETVYRGSREVLSTERGWTEPVSEDHAKSCWTTRLRLTIKQSNVVWWRALRRGVLDEIPALEILISL